MVARPPRKLHGLPSCVLCGARPTTKEHAWPSYIRKHLANQEKGPGKVGVLYRDEKGQLAVNYTNMHGKADELTYRILCETCNNKFSGDIQNFAKPALMNAINDRTIDPIHFSALYEWMALFAIRTAFETNHEIFLEREFCYQYRQGLNRNNIHAFVGLSEHHSLQIGSIRSYRAKPSDSFLIGSLEGEKKYSCFEQSTCIKIGRFIGYVVIEHVRDEASEFFGQFEFIGQKIAQEAGLIILNSKTPIFWPMINEEALDSLSSKMLSPGEQHRSLKLTKLS